MNSYVVKYTIVGKIIRSLSLTANDYNHAKREFSRITGIKTSGILGVYKAMN